MSKEKTKITPNKVFKRIGIVLAVLLAVYVVHSCSVEDYENAYQSGYDSGYDVGYDHGYHTEQTHTYETAYEEGYNQCYREVSGESYKSGYDEGFYLGKQWAAKIIIDTFDYNFYDAWYDENRSVLSEADIVY